MQPTKTPVPTQPTLHPVSELTFPLTIRNRRVVIFEGDIKAMSSLNDRGKFDILPHHGNLISLIKEYITIYKTDGSKQTIPIQNGIIYVRRSEARCYIDLSVTDLTTKITQAQK